jgi:hypothetical protein
MVNYICNECKKEFNHKSDYTRHINKKKSCKIKVNLENKNKKMNDYNLDNDEQILENEKIDILNNDQQILENENEDVLNNILHTLKTLSKDMHVLKESNNELKESNNELNKKIKLLEKSNNNLINQVSKIKQTNIKLINNNNNNNNITINITAFGKEDLNFIDDDMCIKKLIYPGYESIKNYVKLVHFNENKPEYQNIYISNKKNKNEIMVNDGNKWNIAQTNDIIDKLFFKSMTFIKDKLDIMKDDLPKNKIKGVSRLVNDYDEDENKIIKDLSKDIVLEIYNNRDKPIGKSITKLGRVA